jgi:hypothetical protein
MIRLLLRVGSFACLLGSASVGAAFAQDFPTPTPVPVEKAQPDDQAAADPCPKISLKGPNQPVREGNPVRITANIAGGDKKISPMFNWSISAGVIRSGQGTANIEIDTSGAGNERTIYTTLLVGGYSGECSSSENVAFAVASPARIADEFGPLSDEELSKRIESFAASIPPGDGLHIIGYAGRNNVRGYATAKLRQIRTVALKNGILSDRLATVDGGYREAAVFEFWLVPAGAEPPAPSPSISAKDIVFPKATPSAPKPRKP